MTGDPLDVITSTAVPVATPELTDAQKRARLYAKFALVMGGIRRLEKSQENKHQGFKYAPVEDVKDLVRPLLALHNVAYTAKMIEQAYVERPAKNGIRYVTRLVLEFVFVDGDDGGVETVPWTIEASDSGDFAITKALSMGLKYLFMTMFAVSSGSEIDADAGHASIPMAPASLMKQLLAMARKMFPNESTLADDVFIGKFFDKWVAPQADFTLDNATIVLGRLVALAELKPVKSNKQKAQEEVDSIAKALPDNTEAGEA